MRLLRLFTAIVLLLLPSFILSLLALLYVFNYEPTDVIDGLNIAILLFICAPLTVMLIKLVEFINPSWYGFIERYINLLVGEKKPA